jgi:hypothetical protein
MKTETDMMQPKVKVFFTMQVVIAGIDNIQKDPF